MQVVVAGPRKTAHYSGLDNKGGKKRRDVSSIASRRSDLDGTSRLGEAEARRGPGWLHRGSLGLVPATGPEPAGWVVGGAMQAMGHGNVEGVDERLRVGGRGRSPSLGRLPMSTLPTLAAR